MRGNGMSASARATVSRLRAAGEDVRVLAIGDQSSPEEERPDYPLKKFTFPIFQPIIDKSSFCFPISDRKVIEEAVKWADVVHLEEPFPLQAKTARIANRLGVPCVATYHLHPENIFYTLYMGRWRFLNHLFLMWWRRRVFNRCSDVQCPSANAKSRLIINKFSARLHVIPNGLDIRKDIEPSRPETSPYLILTIGRFAREKDQKTLIEAMKYSRYADEIQLYFAGHGPIENSIRRKAAALDMKYPPKFGFHTPEELRELENKAYLYIHCAVVEVEGLSCIEALREGAVPVIGRSRLSATSQFALCPASIFQAGNPRQLAERIDWWIEHPEKREEMSSKYSESMLKYDIKYSIEALRQMYATAVNERA